MLHTLIVALLAAVEPLPPLPPEPTGRSLRLPGPELRLTLEEAVALALKNHPDVGRAQAQVEQAAGAARSAGGRQLPIPSVTYTYQTNPQAGGGLGLAGGSSPASSPDRQAEPPPVPELDLSRFIARHSLSLSVSQLLFDFGRAAAATEQPRRRAGAARQSLAAAAGTVADQVRQRYYGLLQAEGLVEVRRADLEARRATLGQARARFEVGQVPYGDMARATASVAQAQTALSQAQVAAEAARDALNQALGIPPNTFTQASPDGQPEPDLPAAAELIAEAYRRRPEVRQAEESIRSERAGVRYANRGNLPALYGSATQSLRGAEWPGETSQGGFGLTLSWTPFDFGITRGQVQEARGRLSEAEWVLRQARLSVAGQVTEAYRNLRGSEENAGNARVAAASARESLRVARVRYAAGTTTLVDVRDAEAALVAAEIDRVNAEYDVSRARAALAHAVGGLIPAAASR